MRDMDATILDKGTDIYKINGEDSKNMVAVKIGTRYYLYKKV